MSTVADYEKATGEKALYRKDSSDYHTLKYVAWLESLIHDMQEVVDAAVRFEKESVIKATPGHCVECDLIIAVKKLQRGHKGVSHDPRP